MEIRRVGARLKSSTAAECRPFCVNVTTPCASISGSHCRVVWLDEANREGRHGIFHAEIANAVWREIACNILPLLRRHGGNKCCRGRQGRIAGSVDLPPYSVFGPKSEFASGV